MRLADPTLIVLCLSILVDGGILFAILRRNNLTSSLREMTPRVLLACVIISLGWLAVQIIKRLQEMRLITGWDTFTLARVTLYMLLALALIFLVLTRLFQRREGKGLGVILAGSAWLALSIVLYENVFNLPARIAVSPTTVLLRDYFAFAVLVIGWGAAVAASLLLTLFDYRRTVSPLHRNRNKYWSMALTLFAIGGGMLLARQAWVGNLLHTLALLTAVFVLLTFNLPDVRLAYRRGLSYLIISVLTILAYTGGFFALQALVHPRPGLETLLAVAGLAAVLTVLFNPLLNITSRFLNGLISSVHYDQRQMLSEYSMNISNILDLEVLATIVVGLISDAMESTHGALVTIQHDEEPQADPNSTAFDPGTVFLGAVDLPAPSEAAPSPAPFTAGQPVRTQPIVSREDRGVYLFQPTSQADQENLKGRLSGQNPVVQTLRREHHPLTQYDIDLLPRYQTMDPAERVWLSSLKMDVYVPVYVKETWIGLLMLGPKASGDRYFDDDLAFLQTLADQTAVALENARLYNDVRQRNAENERLNRELTSANEELARLDHAKSDFINIASHELRTPLTQVIGYNDILGEMIRAGQVQPNMALTMTDSVRKAARRLEEIVETMFDVSKLESRTLDLMRAPVSMASIMTAAIDTWQQGITERKLSLAVRGINNLPLIYADGKRLTQVFSNLIQNAIKSTPDGGQIRIVGRLDESEDSRDRCIEVVIADTGIGLASDDLERIFDKFYRVGNVLLHSTGETKFKGAGPGLGLTIARGIVEAHGGSIWAESPGFDEENCPGSRFHVLLPLIPQNIEPPKPDEK